MTITNISAGQQTNPKDLDYRSLADQGLINSGLALYLEQYFKTQTSATTQPNNAAIVRSYLEKEEDLHLFHPHQTITGKNNSLSYEEQLLEENRQLRSYIESIEAQKESLQKELLAFKENQHQATTIQMEQLAEEILEQAQKDRQQLLEAAYQERMTRYRDEIEFLKDTLRFITQQRLSLKKAMGEIHINTTDE